MKLVSVGLFQHRNGTFYTIKRTGEKQAWCSLGTTDKNEALRKFVIQLDIASAETQSTTASENAIVPAPSDRMLGVSLSFTLPLWSRNKAEIQTPQFTTEQAENTLQSAELKAEVQVRQAYTTYHTDFSLRLHYFEDAGKTGACRSDTA
jgi:GTP-sensing pleiotropic transcriptional regulator CodY